MTKWKDKKCRNCKFGEMSEYCKPCVIYKDDCQLYKEKKPSVNDELIEGLKQLAYKMKREGDPYYQHIAEDAIKLLEQTEWILCSEKLPEENGYYLTTIKIEIHDLKPYYEIRAAKFDGEDFDIGYIGDGFRVIAWMPPIQPYKDDEEE